MNAKLNPLRLSVVSAALAFSFAVPQANAADAKTYPGMMGVRISGATPSYYHGTIRNPSATQWLTVRLPAINDTMSDPVIASNVRVIDRHFYEDVGCSFKTLYYNNTVENMAGWWTPVVYSEGSPPLRQHLDTGGIGGASNIVHSYFDCRIPPTYEGYVSYIISYYVREG